LPEVRGAAKSKKPTADDSDEDLDDWGSDEEFIEKFREANPQDDSDEEIVDLLDPHASKLLMRNKKKKRTDDDAPLKSDEHGRLIVEDDRDENPKKKAISHKSDHADDVLPGKMLGKRAGKRSKLREEDDDDDDEKPVKKQLAPKRRKLDSGASKYSGKEYQSRKGSGDVKVAGRHDPFAYVPMNPQNLNKRYVNEFLVFWPCGKLWF
jgi:ribosomal RNA-processing protein 12